MNQERFKRAFIFALWLMLNACSTFTVNKEVTAIMQGKPNQPKKPQTFVYECQNNYSFTVNIEGEMAWVFLPEQTISLLRIPSASGVKYTDGQRTFWSKGSEASLNLGSIVHKRCINNAGKAIWEHAKLNGADFRAVGNEPGWDLEIMHDKKLEFTRQYGKVSYSFNTSQRETDQSAHKTIYSAREKGHSLSVTILGDVCHDTMSDESFESTVTVVLDDKTYKGCGKALH